MTTFNRGDKVIVHQPNSAFVATIDYATIIGIDHGYAVNTADGTLRFVDTWPMTLLPADAPLFQFGQDVLVVDAGRDGRAAVVTDPECRGDLFGYWLHLTDTGERVWVPAQLLAPVEAGERR